MVSHQTSSRSNNINNNNNNYNRYPGIAPLPQPPSDINSAEYAVWYQQYMAHVQAQQQQQQLQHHQLQLHLHAHAVQSNPVPDAAIAAASSSDPQSRFVEPSAQTKLQQAMAYLKQRQLTGASSASSSSSAPKKPEPKQSPFSPEKKPAYVAVKPADSIPKEKPSYAAVASSASNSQQSAKQKSQQSGHPDSLKAYVSKVFSLCTKENRGEVELYLKAMIENIQRKGALFTTDWEKMSLPPVLTTTDSKPSLKVPATTPAPPQTSKKRKKFSLDLLQDGTSISSSPNLNPNKLDSKTPSAINSPDLQSIPEHLRAQELERRETRAKRFQADADTHSTLVAQRNRDRERAQREMAAVARVGENLDVIDWDEYTIVGVSEVLEKGYLRLTSAPDPSTVRPLHILRQTLDLLGRKWKQDQNYPYICDQFKSLRQDLTVQRIRNDFTVKVYESHARIALEKGDVGEYNQCQAQLKELYKLGLKGNVDEFTGYRILYMVYTMNRTDQVKILSSLPTHQTPQTHPSTTHALRVRAAVSLGDYHSLFRLYNSAPCMSAYLMDLFVDRERIKALQTMSRAFRPSLKVGYIARELGYTQLESNNAALAQSISTCYEWLKNMGTPFVTREEDVSVIVGKGRKARAVVQKAVRVVGEAEGDVGEVAVDCKAAAGFFAGKVVEILGKGVDIKGQIH